ncbi:undecaprenyl-phosphate glucose phosphotransferase [Rubrivirga sp.]|uniref:undecaprenyl-phosphate glucose phosphotransferase n=1 Tax=Rubrivirga sp. TaxID=1885344 RepID=UPI003C72F7F9
MLRERSVLLQRLLLVADLALVALAWILAWVLRFEVLTPPEWVSLEQYIGYLPFVLAIWGGVLLVSGLYRTHRAQRLPLVVFAVGRAVALGLVASFGASFFYREFSFSRLHVALFAGIASVLLVGLRLSIYVVLRRGRQQGRNVRRVLIVGAGKAGQRLARAFHHYPWMGFEVLGFLDDRDEVPAEPSRIYPEPVVPPNVLGRVDDIERVLDRYQGGVDLVYAALPLAAAPKIEAVADACARHTAHLALVPDLLGLDLLNSRISDVDGLPVIHLLDEAPLDVRQLAKRVWDIGFSVAALVLLSPLLAVIAIAVKLSSPGPILYKQTRMSLNGQTFEILKFRSMPVNAEAGTGAVWSTKGESRATPVGSFLRRTSLDELPQFWNVLRGDMSVVGPRPERPSLIEGFRHEIPGYMLRHKTKAGITGWAQVHGWRGDTSLTKRIEYDLWYISNWSLWLDLKIIVMTVFKGFVHENAH